MPKKKYEEENSRDDWVRMTLRLPPALHKELLARAGALSMNAVIVQRLANSLLTQDVEGMVKEAIQSKKEAARDLEMSSEIVSDVLAQKEKFWKEGFKEGQKQGLAELKTLIERTVAEVVRTEIRETLGNPSCNKP